MTKETEKLNELIDNDFELRLDLQKIDIDIDGEYNYEDDLSVNKLQIINKILENNGYQPVFHVENKPSQKLIWQYLNDFAQDIIDGFTLSNGNSEIEFRTDNHGDNNINRLLDNNYEATGMYVSLEAPNNSTMSAEIEFDEFDEEFENIADYLDKTSDDLYYEIRDTLYSFDADEEFDQLWHRDSGFSAREFLRILDEDQEFFEKVANRM